VISDRPADADAISALFLAAEFSCVIETDCHRDPASVMQTLRPDLVLLDLAVAESDDLGLVRRIRAAATGEAFLPLLVAGEAASRWRAEALAAGADDIVLKPLVAEELLARVYNLLVTRWLHHQQRELSRRLPEMPARRSVPDEESFLKAMANSLEEAVLACDTDGKLRFANSAAIRWGLGPLQPGQRAALAPGRLRSTEGRELTVDEDPLRRAGSGQDVVDQELTIGTPQRGERTLLANSRSILADPGRRLGAVVVLHDITDQHRVAEELRRGLLHDELTGLPNDILFLDLADRVIARIARDHQPLLLIVITLDEMDDVRDYDVSGGPLPFSSLLAALASRLPRLLRPGDIAARYGDGFALLCLAPVDDSNAHHIVERLRAGLSLPVEISRQSVTPRLSFGIATAHDAETSAQRLIQIARSAMRRKTVRRTTTPIDDGAEVPASEWYCTGWGGVARHSTGW
jgi:diguanylate cyclase (GGDEF)-like protein